MEPGDRFLEDLLNDDEEEEAKEDEGDVAGERAIGDERFFEVEAREIFDEAKEVPRFEVIFFDCFRRREVVGTGALGSTTMISESCEEAGERVLKVIDFVG